MSHLLGLTLVCSPIPFIAIDPTQYSQEVQAPQPQSHAQIQVLSLQELLCHISSYLDLRDISTCCLVSQQWHRNWSPICWQDIIRKNPKSFFRNGHLTKTLDLKGFKSLNDIRDHCPNLRSLKCTEFRLTVPIFEDMVLGIKPEPKLVNKRDQLKGVELEIRNSPNPFIKDLGAENGFLSNSLNSVELYLPPAVCEILIPRFIQARRAGRLQNLMCFHMGSAIIHYTCIEIPLPKTCYLKMSGILVFLNEFSDLESFSTGDMEIIDDCGENEAIYTTKLESIDNDLISASNQERYQEQKEYRLMKLEITPSSSRMFERLVSKMSRLTSLSLYFVGTINLLPAIQKHCQNLTSLALDMSAHYYPNDPIDDLNPDQEQKYKDWILLFKALPKLERFAGSSVSMPTVVLKTLAASCPNLKHFRACEDSILATSGVSFLLQNCLALKDLILEQHYSTDLFGGDQAWKAPLENLHFDVVRLFNEEENDCFRKRIYQLPKLKSLKIAYASKMSIRAILNPNDKDSEVVGEPLALDLATPSDGRISHDIIAPNVPCPNLEILALGYFSEKSYEMFLRIVDSMPRLQSLIIGEQYSREAIMSARNRNK